MSKTKQQVNEIAPDHTQAMNLALEDEWNRLYELIHSVSFLILRFNKLFIYKNTRIYPPE